ncbi:MAG: type II toxin-antitoxin system prevent-host-death family antitoxin [Deltaproteobacteria bacterium]|nr:type II toxin-antitoxin system prevent-host-death family antitoxin [Deltaproteobacteria bacterium]
MEKVTAYEAKTHLPRLLREVVRGKRLCITRKGLPVAVLFPIEEGARHKPREVIAGLRQFRKGVQLKGLSVREMIAEGRRF